MVMTLWGEELPQEEYKRCSICDEIKHIHEFQLRSGKKENFYHTKQNRRNECSSCKKKLNKQTQIAKQLAPPCPVDHVCPICERDEQTLRGEHNGWGNKSPFVLDHCHVTGKFRDWICQHCNIAIGSNGLNENIEALKNAIKYLTKYA